MTPSETLLVTGSQCMANTPAAQRWARAMILRAMADILERTDRVRVVVGDASGVDEEAHYLTTGLNTACECVALSVFGLDGRVVHTDRKNETWTTETPPTRGDPARRKWPLKRNEAMVKRVATRAKSGARVTVLSLKAPWSRTDGTGHTARLAAEAELAVIAHTCPAEYAPVRTK